MGLQVWRELRAHIVGLRGYLCHCGFADGTFRAANRRDAF